LVVKGGDEKKSSEGNIYEEEKKGERKASLADRFHTLQIAAGTSSLWEGASLGYGSR